jgi:hypothetical protein
MPQPPIIAVAGKNKKKNTKNTKNTTSVVLKTNKNNKNHSSGPGSTARSIGRTLGGFVGLGDIGEAAGNLFHKITGMGSYKVHTNSFMTDSQAPTFSYHGDNSLTLTFSEFVCDVTGTADFQNIPFDIRPDSLATFPFLANIARNYESYEFLGLVFLYKSTSGNSVASDNTALGTVTLATEYDVSRPNFSNKVEAENYQFSTTCKPSENMLHPVECNPKLDTLNMRYTQSPYVSSLGTQNDVADNLRIVGRLQVISSQNPTAGAALGQLFATYKIKLTKPRVIPQGTCTQLQHYTCNNFGGVTSTGDIFSNMTLLTDSTLQPGRGIGPYLGTGNRIYFDQCPPSTRYRVDIYMQATTNFNFNSLAYTGVQQPGYFLANTVTNNGNGANESGRGTTNNNLSFIVDTPSNNNELGPIMSNTVLTGITYSGTVVGDVFITVIPNFYQAFVVQPVASTMLLTMQNLLKQIQSLQPSVSVDPTPPNTPYVLVQPAVPNAKYVMVQT